ncbi:MAG: hypothetical protein LC708_00040 [Actinobacteria bacterium]|nr:hypothetical protein [Actinomycetota bacterium]
MTEYVYDAVGRVRGSRVSGGVWSCTAYDARGRVTSQSFPAWDGHAERTVTFDHAVGLNPLKMSVADPSVATLLNPTGAVTTTLDLLGRVVAHSDVWLQETTSAYDQPGRLVTTRGPRGRVDTEWEGYRPKRQHWADDRLATGPGALVAQASYHGPGTFDAGLLKWVDYPLNASRLASDTSAIPLSVEGQAVKRFVAASASS